MPRLPYVIPEEAPAVVRQTLDQLPAMLNVFRMMAHAETSFAPLVRLGASILAQQKLSPRLRELAILRSMAVVGCRYEWLQHASIAMLAGVTRYQVQAIEQGNVGADCFDETERLVLELATDLAKDVRSSGATFERLRERLSPREMVELVIAVGYYAMVARLVETTGVEVESPAEQTALLTRKLPRRSPA